MTMDTYQRWLEAKRADQDSERESAGAETCPRETPVPEEAPLAIAGSSKTVSPTETTHQGERVWRPCWVSSSTFMPSTSR